MPRELCTIIQLPFLQQHFDAAIAFEHGQQQDCWIHGFNVYKIGRMQVGFTYLNVAVGVSA